MKQINIYYYGGFDKKCIYLAYSDLSEVLIYESIDDKVCRTYSSLYEEDIENGFDALVKYEDLTDETKNEPDNIALLKLYVKLQSNLYQELIK